MTRKRRATWREPTRAEPHTNPKSGGLESAEQSTDQLESPKSVAPPCVEVGGELVVENSPARTPRDALDRIAGGALRGQLVGEVARKFQHHPSDEIEEAFHEAYTRGLTSCRWRRDIEVYGWLRRTMVNWLIAASAASAASCWPTPPAERSSAWRTRARSRSEFWAAAKNAKS